MSLGTSASLKLTHPSGLICTKAGNSMYMNSICFCLCVCVCDAEKELGPLLMQTAISTAAAAAAQPQQRSRSVSHSSGALTLVLAPSDITVRSKKETQAAKRAAGITGSKRHHRLDWQGG